MDGGQTPMIPIISAAKSNNMKLSNFFAILAFFVVLSGCATIKQKKLLEAESAAPTHVHCALPKDEPPMMQPEALELNNAFLSISDELPPPVITSEHNWFPHIGTFIRFDYPPDVDFDWFYFKIWQGKEQKVFQVVPRGKRHTYKKSLHELQLTDTTTPIQYEIYSVKGAKRSPSTFSNFLQITPKPLAQDAYTFKYKLETRFGYDASGNIDHSGGWTAEEVQQLTTIIDRGLPILLELCGNTVIPDTLMIYKHQQYTGSNVFQPSGYWVGMGKFAGPRVLFHELIHAIFYELLGLNRFGIFDTQLAGFYESRAEALAFIAMNRYIERYGKDDFVPYYGNTSDLSADLDFRNVDNLTTKGFWSDQNGMGLALERYRVGAALIEKIENEHPGTHRRFFQQYIKDLDSGIPPSREMVVNNYLKLFDTIEGIDTRKWFDSFRSFDAQIVPGKKVFLWKYRRFDFDGFGEYNRVYLSETYPNGSEWSFDTLRHRLNGAKGFLSIADYQGNKVFADSIQLKPTDNPPVFNGFGSYEFNVSSEPKDKTQRFKTDDNPFVQISDLGLYTITATFGEISQTEYRVYGKELGNLGGIAGGIIGASNGVVSFEHSETDETDMYTIQNGAFAGKASFANVFNSKYKQSKAIPGELTITYTNTEGEQFRTKRQISYGDYIGNLFFLFDLSQMEPVKQLLNCEETLEKIKKLLKE